MKIKFITVALIMTSLCAHGNGLEQDKIKKMSVLEKAEMYTESSKGWVVGSGMLVNYSIPIGVTPSWALIYKKSPENISFLIDSGYCGTNSIVGSINEQKIKLKQKSTKLNGKTACVLEPETNKGKQFLLNIVKSEQAFILGDQLAYSGKNFKKSLSNLNDLENNAL